MENGQDTQEPPKAKDEFNHKAHRAKEEDADAQSKRLKSLDPSNLKDFVLPGLLDEDDGDNINTNTNLRTQYAASVPYRHAAIPQVFQTDFFNAVIHEIQQYSKVNFKESDLFRVYQSMDLANLTEAEHATTMPNVWKLRQVLYSQPWRQWMERTCGLEPHTLTNKVDCACNCHIAGCHLLCHDDVIGTRKVSYIIYMTEENWQLEEGGALELYDREPVSQPKEEDSSSSKNKKEEKNTVEYVPVSIPSITHLPLRNSMAFFVVEPGVSFHAVQEVFGDRPRLSLQGWYHAPEPPAQMEQATLQRLKNKKSHDIRTGAATGDADEQTFCPYPTPPTMTAAAAGEDEKEPTLAKDDEEYLAKYIQATYLQAASIKEIKKRFEEESSVQLREFLCDQWVQQLSSQMQKEDEQDTKPVTDSQYYQQGVKNGWVLTGPAHKQRYLAFDSHAAAAPHAAGAAPQTMGEIMTVLRVELLESQPFRRYLALLTCLGEPLGYRGCTRRFRRGLDYTVAHHGLLMEQSVLDATLCFVAGRGQDVQTEMEKNGNNEDKVHPDDIMWQSGDYGGFECYISADDEEEGQEGTPAAAADEYNEDDDTELLSVSASNNTLNLVYRDEGTMRFVKYVGSKAPSSRWDVAMVYEVQQDEEEKAEESEDEGR